MLSKLMVTSYLYKFLCLKHKDWSSSLAHITPVCLSWAAPSLC